MEGDEGGRHLDDLLLLAPREFGGLFKDFLQAALGGVAFGFGRLEAEEFINADGQGLRHFGKHLAAGSCAAEFPKGDVGVMNAKFFGELHLCQARGLSEAGDPLSEGRAVFFAHEGRIAGDLSREGLRETKGLHSS